MKNQSNKRITFGKIPEIIEAPDLLNIQLESWESFLQADVRPARRKNKGLQAVFKMNFPVTDARENFLLEFVEYYVEKPKYSVAECEERGLTYAVPIKAKLRLSQKAEDGKSLHQHHRAGRLPRQPADHDAPRHVHHQRRRARRGEPAAPLARACSSASPSIPNGTPIYSARIIPFRGSWVEFTTDINNVMYAYIDRKKKFPVTTLLRALGYSSDDEILQLFNLVEEVDVAKVGPRRTTRAASSAATSWTRRPARSSSTRTRSSNEDHIKRIKKSERQEDPPPPAAGERRVGHRQDDLRRTSSAPKRTP